MNKDTQTAGGTKGFSLKAGAVTKYYINAEHRSTCLKQIREMTRINTSKFSHADLQTPCIKRDVQDVDALRTMMETNWINPMETEADLVNISTGQAAAEQISDDLRNALHIGEEAYQEFKEKRIESDPPCVKFHDTMKKQNLKTFTNMNKKQGTVNVSGKELVLKADRNFFGQMILVAQSRNIDLQDVLMHPLGPIPWSLASNDGSLRKTNKAALSKILIRNVMPAENIPSPRVCIIDGMSLVQKHNGNGKTFSQIAKSTFAAILQEGYGCERIDVVFDTYQSASIKGGERERRGTDGGNFKCIRKGHRVQQWRKFLSNINNKNKLIEFLNTEWQGSEIRQKLGEKILFSTCGSKCFKLSKGGYEEVEEL